MLNRNLVHRNISVDGEKSLETNTGKHQMTPNEPRDN